jgi:transcriptional regulator with GAF, ATPase, and Fis domain
MVPVSEDLIHDVLLGLGRPADGDSLAAADAALRADGKAATALIDRLGARLPAEPGLARGRALVAIASAHLARRDAARARDLLTSALPSLEGDPRASARGWLRLASAELALGRKSQAVTAAARVVVEVMGSRDEALVQELGAVLMATGQTLATAVDHAPREEPAKGEPGERLAVLARLLHALNSAASGTSEPLYAILRAILDETQADRGFLMVYDADTLRFELGLTKAGYRLGPSDFAFSTTIVEQALESGRCVVIPDISRALPVSESSSARELGLQAALCAPLRIERRRSGAAAGASIPQVRNLAGVLYVDATTVGRFRESDASFFEVLADGAVLALRARAALAQSKAPPAAGSPALEPRLAQTAVQDPELARRYPEFATRDPALRTLLGLVDRVAPSDAHVLIRGESGTGKELLARAIHRRGLRGAGPFEVLDCATLHEELATSELFGHEKNAFTGATAPRAGAFERASGGTLFLDQIGELPLALQASLLRVLQEGEVRRLGSDRVRRVDVRVVAATHRDLKAMVESGEFRHDLLFRLAVIQLKLPPLRERRGDIPLLARHFLARTAAESGTAPLSIESEALVRLDDHGWPGNVRELENVLAAASLHAEGGSITRAGIDQLLGRARPVAVNGGTIEEIERRAIEERLEMFHWNQAQAAKSLGLDRNTLRRKIVRHGIVRRERGPARPE